MKYANQTTVSVARSRAEIEEIITRYHADQFGTALDNEGCRAMVQFRLNKIVIRFELPLPNRNEDTFKFYRRGGYKYLRSDTEAERHWEQACRQRWRALALSIKAKLEAVECGITTFEEEFLSHIVLPNGQTFGKVALPQLQLAIEDGRMPSNLFLPAPAGS